MLPSPTEGVVNLVAPPTLKAKRLAPVLALYPLRTPLDVSNAHTTLPVTMGGPAGKPESFQRTWNEFEETRRATSPSVHGTNTVLPDTAVPPNADEQTCSENS